MARALWIAEKKSLAEAVGKVLGTAAVPWDNKGLTFNTIGENDFVWLDGHAFKQAMPDHYLSDDVPIGRSGQKVWRKSDLPIVPDDDAWTLLPDERKAARLSKLSELLDACDVVYHLGDPDSEGQLLVDEALGFYGNRKPVRRVLVNDYNESKVREALASVRDNSESMFRGWYRWALARSRYDWLVGLNGTRAITLRGRELGFDGVLPVGSVQTPILYIIRERDREIEEFKPQPYFLLSGHFKHANGTFRALWKAMEDQPGLDSSGRLIDTEIARSLAQKVATKQGTVVGYEKARKEEAAPLTMSLNELQMEGFKRYGYSAAEVLAAAQTLYEVYKVSTYPRSDNRYLSEAQHTVAPAVFDAIFKLRPDLASMRGTLDVKRKSAAFNDKKMEGTPHHGIVPTIPETAVDVSKWKETERNIYDLIVRSYLSQFAAPFVYMKTRVDVVVVDETFVAHGRTPVSQGWKLVLSDTSKADAGDADSPAENAKDQTLPDMQRGDGAECVGVKLDPKKTTPPERFDELLILDAMMNVHKYVTNEASKKRLKEGDGIGTTATRAPMIEDLKARELLVPVKEGSKKLMTSQAARALIDALPFDVKDPAQAGVFKASLDRVASGDLSFERFMAETVEWVRDIVQKADTLQMKLPLAAGTVLCPKCKTGQLRRKNNEATFWFCTNWRREPDKCDAQFQDMNGRPLTAAPTCPSCKLGTLRYKKGEKGAFWFCSRWNAEQKCEAKFNDRLGKPDLSPPPACPTCKTGILRSINGQNGKFWGCSRYNEGCKASFPDKLGKPDFTPKPVYRCPVCKKGELRSIKGPNGPFWGCNRYGEGCKSSYPDKAGKPDLLAKKR